MALPTRGSRMAIVSESTEGTLAVPSSATDYLALQEGFSLVPEFENLESAELRGSIGAAQPIRGLENPSLEIDHYIKHSGVEGTAPEDDLLIKSAFGTSASRGTERDTVAGSSTSVVNVDTGEGTEFVRGDALLIKHGAFPYEIRPVLSVSSDALTLGFNASNAPASGTNLGKNVVFRPADSGHPTVSAWDYRGDGAAVQAMAGGRVSELSMKVEAGQLVNGSYKVNGTSFYFNPIYIQATDTKMDFIETGPTTRAATITAGMYKDPHDFASALETAMDSVATDDITVSYSDSTGKFTISSNGSLLTLKWATGLNTANTVGDAIGFDVSADDTGSLSYTADFAIHAPGGSNTTLLSSPQTPTLDSSQPLAAKDNEVLIGDATDTTCANVNTLTFTLTDEVTPVNTVCAVSGRAAQVTTKRMATVELVAYLSQYDAQKFKRYRTGSNVGFLYTFGTKSGGNWEAGKSGCLYIPTATISAFQLDDQDGIITLNLTLTAYVATDGSGEVFLNFV